MTAEGKGQGAKPGRGARAQVRFDAFHVATRGGAVEGHLDATRLSRLDDLLAPTDEAVDIHFRIAGAEDTSRPALEISLNGSVPLVCQRCLQKYVWPVDQHTVVLLARDERELARLDEADPEHEVVLADAALDAATLIEDELVLTLPFVPRCPEEACQALAADQSTAKGERSDRLSAFKELAQLRSTPQSKTRG